jgi:ribosomal protein S18 acetylase RimI-like enzyme
MKIEQKEFFTQKDKQDISILILSSLHEKILPVLGEKKKAILLLQKSYSSKNCFFIKENNSIVAFLAFKTKKNNFFNPSLTNFTDVYGLLGLIKALTFNIIDHKVKTEEIHIEAITVNSTFRGKGIGSNLIQHFFNYAKKNRFRIASLEVVDTNKKAFSLYDKIGFSINKRSSIKFLKWFFPFKFNYVLLMEKRLNR